MSGLEIISFRLVFVIFNGFPQNLDLHQPALGSSLLNVLIRSFRYYGCGPMAGILFCAVMAFIFLTYRFIDWWMPKSSIDEAIDFPEDRFADLDDHDFFVNSFAIHRYGRS